LQECQQESDAVRRRVEETARSIRVLERDLKSLETRIAQLRQQQSQVKDNKAYQALNSEIAAFAAQTDQKETEALQQIEALEQLQKKQAALQADCQGKEHQIERCRKELDDVHARAAAQQQELAREIETCTTQLPADIVAVIAKLRTRMSLPVVHLDGQACGGCHAQFPTQVALEINRGCEVIRCQTCGRYVVSQG
jgi:predicted  nucleic acid-binding Zn-ribbon protein